MCPFSNQQREVPPSGSTSVYHLKQEWQYPQLSFALQGDELSK